MACNFINTRLQRRYFPMKLAFLRTLFYRKTPWDWFRSKKQNINLSQKSCRSPQKKHLRCYLTTNLTISAAFYGNRGKWAFLTLVLFKQYFCALLAFFISNFERNISSFISRSRQTFGQPSFRVKSV